MQPREFFFPIFPLLLLLLLQGFCKVLFDIDYEAEEWVHTKWRLDLSTAIKQQAEMRHDDRDEYALCGYTHHNTVPFKPRDTLVFFLSPMEQRSTGLVGRRWFFPPWFAGNMDQRIRYCLSAPQPGLTRCCWPSGEHPSACIAVNKLVNQSRWKTRSISSLHS